MIASTWVERQVEHLNKNYHGSFRALSDALFCKEVIKKKG